MKIYVVVSHSHFSPMNSCNPFSQAVKRAELFGIPGVTYSLTQVIMSCSVVFWIYPFMVVTVVRDATATPIKFDG